MSDRHIIVVLVVVVFVTRINAGLISGNFYGSDFGENLAKIIFQSKRNDETFHKILENNEQLETIKKLETLKNILEIEELKTEIKGVFDFIEEDEVERCETEFCRVEKLKHMMKSTKRAVSGFERMRGYLLGEKQQEQEKFNNGGRRVDDDCSSMACRLGKLSSYMSRLMLDQVKRSENDDYGDFNVPEDLIHFGALNDDLADLLKFIEDDKSIEK